jgi:hypothetical protein
LLSTYKYVFLLLISSLCSWSCYGYLLASSFLKQTKESFFLFITTVHTAVSLISPTFLYYQCASGFKYNVSSCSEIWMYIYCYSMWRPLFWRKLNDLYTCMLGLVLQFTNCKLWRFFALCKYEHEVQRYYNITIHALFRN